MIRHIVLFQLAPTVHSDDPRVQRAAEAEHRLAEQIPEGHRWRFGPSITRRDISADFAGVGDFESLESLGRFLAHPAHQVAAELWRDLATWTVADLDLGTPMQRATTRCQGGRS